MFSLGYDVSAAILEFVLDRIADIDSLEVPKKLSNFAAFQVPKETFTPAHLADFANPGVKIMGKRDRTANGWRFVFLLHKEMV